MRSYTAYLLDYSGVIRCPMPRPYQKDHQVKLPVVSNEELETYPVALNDLDRKTEKEAT